MVCIFCACNITLDLTTFVQLSTIIVLFNKNEICTRFLITPVVLTAQKKTNNILWLMFQEFHIFNEVNWLSVVTNEFKYLKQLSSRLATVMFRGTPCISSNIESKIKSDLRPGRPETRQTWDQQTWDQADLGPGRPDTRQTWDQADLRPGRPKTWQTWDQADLRLGRPETRQT